MASSMDVDLGEVGPCKVMDKAVAKHCDNAHEGDTARCLSHELMANGSTHAIVHHKNMQANGFIRLEKAPLVQVHFDYYDKGEPEPCIARDAINQTITQPIFTCFSNSYLSPEKAMVAFDFTGGGDDDKDTGDSQYGQGLNIGAHGLSKDCMCLLCCYNGMVQGEKGGTVTLYKIMEASSRTADTRHTHHDHLTVKFFVSDDGTEINWLNKDGDMKKAPTAKQDTLSLLKEQCFLCHIKKNGVQDPTKTGTRLEEILLSKVIAPADSSDAKAAVLLLFTGNSWIDSSPIQKIQKTVRGKQVTDLMCRTKNGEKSLGTTLLREWPDLAISTENLPSGNAVCYQREVQVSNWNIDDLGTRDATLDWQIHVVEQGMNKTAEDPGYTKAVTIPLTNDKCALLRMTVHPDSRDIDRHQTLKKGYGARETEVFPEGHRFAGGRRQSGGPLLFNSRVLGTIPELMNGDYTRLQKHSGIAFAPSLTQMMNSSMQKVFIESVVDVIATKLGCHMSLNGDYSEADHEMVEGIIRGGLNTIYTMMVSETKQGIKPDGRIDLIPRMFGYGIISTLELDCPMAPNKIQMQNTDDAEDLLIGTFREQFIFFLNHDPLGIALMEKVNSPGFEPLQFKPRSSSGVPRPMSAPSTLAERRARPTKSNKTAAQREAHRINDRANHEVRTEDAPTYVAQQIRLYTAKLLGEPTWEAVQARPPAGSTTIETKLRLLASNTNGLANITLDAKAAATRGRWKIFAMTQVAEFIGSAHEDPTLEQLKILNQLWYDAAMPLKKMSTFDRDLNRPAKPKSKKRARVSVSDRPSSSAAGSSSGLAPPGAEDALVPPGDDDVLPAEVRELLPSGDGDWKGGSYDPMKSVKRGRPSEGAMNVHEDEPDDVDEDDECEEVDGQAVTDSEASSEEDE